MATIMTKALSPEKFPSRESEDGWTPLEFYAWIIRTLGIPDRFRLENDEWVADAPFTKPSEDLLALLDNHGV